MVPALAVHGVFAQHPEPSHRGWRRGSWVRPFAVADVNLLHHHRRLEQAETVMKQDLAQVAAGALGVTRRDLSSRTSSRVGVGAKAHQVHGRRILRIDPAAEQGGSQIHQRIADRRHLPVESPITASDRFIEDEVVGTEVVVDGAAGGETGRRAAR